MKINDKYLQRLGVLPYEEDTRTRARGTRGIAWDADRMLRLTRTEVTAQPRRLRAQWRMELAEDLRNVHGIDVEEHLTQLLMEGVNEQEGQLGEANRALDELVAEGQERGDYDSQPVQVTITEESSSSALDAFRAWVRAVRS